MEMMSEPGNRTQATSARVPTADLDQTVQLQLQMHHKQDPTGWLSWIQCAQRR